MKKWLEEHWIYVLVLFAALSFMLPFIMSDGSNVSGAAVATLPSGQGCCLTTCTVTGDTECASADFVNGQDCTTQSQCNIGCCIDTEGYCYTNYLERNCDAEGGQFLGGRECFVEKQCLTPPPRPAEQEGYPSTGTEGIFSIAGAVSTVQYGDDIPIIMELFEDEGPVTVRVEVSSDATGYSEVFTAKDDGFGADAFSDDLRYSFYWDSNFDAVVPSTFTEYELQVFVDGVKRGDPGILTVTPNECRPLRVSDAGEVNILLTKRGSGPDVNFNYEYQKLVEFYAPDRTKADVMNAYVFDTEVFVTPGNINSICPGVTFAADDLVIQYDFDYETCTEEHSNIVHTNPDYNIVRRVNDSAIGSGFCNLIETKKDAVKRVELMNITPEVELVTPIGNTVFTTPLTDITFRVNDNPGKVRYNVYLDHDYHKLGWGYMQAGDAVTTQIPVYDGEHSVTIEVEDLNRNINEIHFNYTANLDNFTSNFRQLSGSVFELELDHNNETIFEYYVFNEQTPISRGVYQKGVDEEINVTLPNGNHTIWVRSEEVSGRRSVTDPYDINVSGAPDEGRTYDLITGASIFDSRPLKAYSLITGAAVATSSSTSGLTVTRADNGEPAIIGEELEDGGIIGRDGYIYYPVIDDSALHNPVKLCGLNASLLDTGARYYPYNCVASSTLTSIDMDPRLKNWGNGTFYYDYYYDVVACAEDIFIDVYLYNNETEAELELESESLGIGQAVTDDTRFETVGDFNQLCVHVSDPLVSNLPRCEEFGLPVCKDDIDNDGDGLCDVDGCYSTTGYWLSADPGCLDENDVAEDDATSQCQDGIDNDADGLIDANDPGCIDSLGRYVPQLNDELLDGARQCQDGLDNDGDGLVDMDDPGCNAPSDDYEAAADPQCQDGLDNDGDGLVDYPDDLGCFSRTDNDEYNDDHDCSLYNDIRFDVDIQRNILSSSEVRYDYNYKITICDRTQGTIGLYDLFFEKQSGQIVPVQLAGLAGFNETFSGSGDLTGEQNMRLCISTIAQKICR